MEGNPEATKLGGTLVEEVKDLHKQREPILPCDFTEGFYTGDFDSEMQQFIESYYNYYADDEWYNNPCKQELWYNISNSMFEVDGMMSSDLCEELTKDEFKLKIGMPL